MESVKALDQYPLLKEAMLQAAAEAVMERSKAASADVSTSIVLSPAFAPYQTLHCGQNCLC